MPTGTAFAANSTPTKTVSTVEEAADFAREQMVKRSENFVIKYNKKITDATQMMNLGKKIKKEALKHTGKPKEGDYINWHFGKYSNSYTHGGSTTTLKFNIGYYTTAAQEKEVDKAVKQILSSLKLENDDNYTKFRKIYDYICKNIKYDRKGFNDTTNTYCHTAHAAITTGSCVCQGYSLLLYRLALEEGIDNRIVARFNADGGHSWNIVKLGRKYYQVDPTWDAGRSTYKYFLKGTDTFPDHSDFVATDKVEDVLSEYDLSKGDYVPDDAVKPQGTTIKKLTPLSKGMTVTYNKQVKNTVGYEIRYSVNKDMSKSKIKKVTKNSVTSKKITGLKSKKKYYVQVRTYNNYFNSKWSSKMSVKTK